VESLHDHSKKHIRSKVVAIALPALVELSLVQLATMVGIMMVGQLGPWAISAVGYCAQPKFLLLSVFIALNTGATALIARATGEGDREQANHVLQTSMMLTFWMSLIISVVGFFGARSMVVFMEGGNSGPEGERILNAATQYMQIQMAGFVFNAMSLSITACLRGIGKTKISMIYNLVANGINVILNYLFVYGKLGFPRWEVAGSSLATAIGQTVAFVIALVVVLKYDDYLRLEIKNFFKVKLDIVKRMAHIGMPAMGEQLVIRAGMVIYTITIATLGSDAFASHNIASSILTMTFMTGQAFGISATSLMGQCLGAKDIEGAKLNTQMCRRIGMLCSIGLVLVFVFLGSPICRLYTGEETIVAESARLLLAVALLQPLQTSQLIISGALRGAGDTMVVAVITFLGVLIVRPLLSMVAINVFHLGLLGAWVAMIIDQSFRSLISFMRFKSNKWVYLKV
ncbi:MAG: MATE family efflux transporter, partial [Clostridiales bacterium]|nr:MATE family efflux transporter [Clostridiales bacterium]